MKNLVNLATSLCLCLILLSAGVGFAQTEKLGIPPDFHAVGGSCVYDEDRCVIFLNPAMPKVRFFVIFDEKMRPAKIVRLEEKDTGIQEIVVWQRNK